MPPDKWERVCLIVDSLGDLPSDERERRLSNDFPGDESVVAEARRLLSRIGSIQNFLSRPIIRANRLLADGSNRLTPGQLVAGRFEVGEFLGAGGMGEVYSALDKELNETVALKTIRQDWGDDPQTLDRFYREVQVARRVTHEHVCRIFDLGQDRQAIGGPLVFLTMQYISGGSLSALLRKGLIPAHQAQSLMADVIAGLAAAHQAGVLHRDLKPGNILLRNPDGTDAVITDFGLALDQSLASEHNRATGAGQLVGTPLYMAPEQLQGETATAAADVYALGLVIYETFSGHLPYSDRNPLGAMIMRSRQMPPGLIDAAVPRTWGRILQRCLEPEPSRRYRDAVEVLRDLEGSRHKLLYRPSRRAWIAAALVMSSSAAVYRYWNWDWKSAFRGKPSGNELLLAPWDVPAGSDLNSLEVPMRKALEQSEHLKLWDPERLPRVLERIGTDESVTMTPAMWRQVALREGVPLVLFTSIAKVADGFSVALRLEQVNLTTDRTPAQAWSHTVEVSGRAALMDAVHEGAEWVRRAAGESAADIASANRLPQDITTSSWEGLTAFSRGERLARSDEAAALMEYDAAIRYDPEFTMAWMRKGDLLVGAEKMGEGLAAWKTAVDLSRKRPLTVKEDLKLRAMFADDSGDYRQSEVLFAEYTHRFPDEYWGYFNRELPLVMLGLDEEAIAMLAACERFPETHSAAWLHLAWIYTARGDISRAEEKARALAAAHFQDRAYWAEVGVAYARGDHARSRDLLGEAQKSASAAFRSQMQQLELSVLADAGLFDEAVRRAREYSTQDLAEGLRAGAAFKMTSAAFLMLGSSEMVGAATLATNAVETDDGLALMVQAGTILARCGHPDRCGVILKRLESGLDCPRYRVARRRLAGEMALARGRRTDARANFEAAAAEDLQPYGHEYLARCAQMQGDYTRAAAEYAAVAKLRNFEFRLLYPELPGIARAAEKTPRLNTQIGPER